MQLVSDESAAAEPRLGTPETAERILGIANELREVERLTVDAERAFEEDRRAEEAAFRRESRKVEEQTRREDEEARAERNARQQALEQRRERRRDRLLRATERQERRLAGELEGEARRAREELERLSKEFSAEETARRGPIEQRVRRWEELLPRVLEGAADTERALRDRAAPYGVVFHDIEPWRGDIEVDADPDRMAEQTERTFDQAVTETNRARSRLGSSLARSGPLYAYQAMIVLAGVVGTLLAVIYKLETRWIGMILGGAGAAIFLLWLAARPLRRRFAVTARELLAASRRAAQRFEQHADATLKHLDRLHIAMAEEHGGKVSLAKGRIDEAVRDRSAPLLAKLEEIRQRRTRAEKRLFARHELRVEALLAEEAAARKARHESRDLRLEALKSDLATRLANVEKDHAERMRETAERRRRALDSFSRYAGRLHEAVDVPNPPWDEGDPAAIVLPAGFPRLVPFGRLGVSLEKMVKSPETHEVEGAAFDLPATLSFPEHGSLLVEHSAGERDAAIGILFDAVLRVLTAFPPGKARLTIFDPVGLGQSFSALMHLADHDEALVNGRIWTEVPHIEQRLSDLTQHLEKIIQKYLRNRYNTIGEYNVEAGELQEPYHFLVVADFPTSISEIAAERLASILSSGPRCGVYTFMGRDTRLEIPPPLSAELLGKNGPVLRYEGDRFRVVGKGLERAEFTPERPPESEAASVLLDSIGRQSVDADRVEVPFEAVRPNEDEIWSDETNSGVRVPIGRTGAERLQYFDLGRGTKQHALIAGRTGSGKSTLFHVLITNMSLWLSPDEVEFYLIDFKKGVEFKPFATHRLPHARVVAIESDREFGLSVLRAVDKELARRGDLFRRAGVQDLAGYRRSNGPESMPRTLVMIDEFQEFFTEDDGVARDAALLLDRFVRQGRAFGIHIVLGSQTLSGIYTLAKGTLGQMGVRISLQCNESDSYLILSEDNGVARLLTRPGEAIYNDMSGLIEGNNPFQVVWLPEAEKADLLKVVAARAEATPDFAPRERIVFEGNLPADLARNEELAELVAGGDAWRERHGLERDDVVWLGEPNAIKGPTRVRFLPASGSNLLIVGQRRDSAFSIMAASMLALSAQHRPAELRLVILDGGGHEPEYAAHFDNLLAAVPCAVERYDLRAVPDAVAELAETLTESPDEDADRPPVYVFAFGLQRLRMLRRGDEFAMPFGDDAPASTGDQFATILTEGPPQNLHTIVWCDTLMNVTRTLDRRTMREFDMRVLFQMSAADSSELIDSTAANLLGLHTALLALESQGTFEKFRPYAVPDAALMRRLGRPD